MKSKSEFITHIFNVKVKVPYLIELKNDGSAIIEFEDKILLPKGTFRIIRGDMR